MYEPRVYRRAMRPEGLVGFRVVVAQSDLFIHARLDLTELALGAVRQLRDDLESYLRTHPRFGESFVPVSVEASAPRVVQEMADAARTAGVGPMASVAGAFAEAVARALEPHSAEVIVENGGDVYLIGAQPRTVALWTGKNAVPLGLVLSGESMPCAVATSSATVGPSVSLGSADAATVIAGSGALADAVASAVGNRVHGDKRLEDALEFGRAIEGVRGVVVCAEGAVAAWGAVELARLDNELL